MEASWLGPGLAQAWAQFDPGNPSVLIDFLTEIASLPSGLKLLGSGLKNTRVPWAVSNVPAALTGASPSPGLAPRASWICSGLSLAQKTRVFLKPAFKPGLLLEGFNGFKKGVKKV